MKLNFKVLNHGLAREVAKCQLRSRASLRIGIDREDVRVIGHSHKVLINGDEIVIYAGDAGVRKGKIQRPADNPGTRAGVPCSHLAAELDTIVHPVLNRVPSGSYRREV